jgi:hypothetical protein
MSYETPPTVSPEVTTAVSTLITAINTNYTVIADKLLTGCYTDSGLNVFAAATTQAQEVSSIPQSIIASLIENQIIPMTQRHDSGWVNHPKDPRGAIMKGVTLYIFRNRFDNILVNTDIADVRTAVTAVDRLLPKWKTDDAQAHQYMYQLLSDQKAMALWVWNALTSANNRYPAAAIAIDPYLGYLLFEFTWTSGSIIYEKAEFDALAKTYGWNGNLPGWIAFIASLRDKSPQFTMDLLGKRALYVNTLIKNFPEFEEGWMGRFINNPGSNLDYLVVINENFNLNKKSLYTYSDPLKQYLEKKAKIYETFKITI